MWTFCRHRAFQIVISLGLVAAALLSRLWPGPMVQDISLGLSLFVSFLWIWER